MCVVFRAVKVRFLPFCLLPGLLPPSYRESLCVISGGLWWVVDPWLAWCIVNFIPSSNVNPSRVACGLRGVTAAAVNRIRRHRLNAKTLLVELRVILY